MKSTMQSFWQAYRDAIYPQGCSAIQNREVHQAFFAGALIAFEAMTKAAATDDHNEAEAMQHLEALAEETNEVCRHKAICARDRN